MKKHYNKRRLEQRWDARQPERLEHIQLKRQLRAKKESEHYAEAQYYNQRMLQNFKR